MPYILERTRALECPSEQAIVAGYTTRVPARAPATHGYAIYVSILLQYYWGIDTCTRPDTINNTGTGTCINTPIVLQ